MFTSKTGVLIKWGFILLVPIFLFSCVTIQEDILYLNDQIATINKKIKTLEESAEAKSSSDVEKNLDSVRSNQAALGAEVDRMRSEIQTLSGRVEENSYIVKRTTERDTTEQDTIRAGLADLSQRLVELEQRVGLMEENLRALASRPAKSKRVTPVPKEKTTPRTRPPKPTVVAKKSAPPDKALYEENLAIYRAGRYEVAITQFEAFLKKHPGSDLADNAQFWVGECYMALNKYEQAILAYEEVKKKYPKGNKVPGAMLRQALAFQELNEKVTAKVLLRKIIKEFPKSSEAKIAESKLKAIK